MIKIIISFENVFTQSILPVIIFVLASMSVEARETIHSKSDSSDGKVKEKPVWFLIINLKMRWNVILK